MNGHYDAAALLTALGVVKQDVNSARPDAPVVPDRRQVRRLARATRLRSTLARALDHLARVVEPPAHRTPYRQPSLRR